MYYLKKISILRIMILFLVCFLLCFSLSGKDLVTAQSSQQARKAKSFDQVEIAYSIYGKGNIALVFIHGAFADQSFWVNQIEPFSKNYTIITIDLAGHGQSGRNREKWDINSFAKDVQAVIEAENIKKAVLVGNSLGGPIILEAAAMIGDKILALIPIDTFQEFVYELPEGYFQKLAQSYRSDYAGTIKQLVRNLFHPDVDPILFAEVEKKMLNCSGEMAARLMESFSTYSSVESAKKVKIPIRCINGDLYPTNIPKNREIHPDFDAVVLNHTGHYPMLECPQIFNKKLEEILKELHL